MSKNKLPKIGGKQIGQNFNATIGEGDEQVVAPIRLPIKEEMQALKAKIAAYNEKPTKKGLDEITAILKPATTKEAVEKEEKTTKVKAEIKGLKKKAKEAGKSVKEKVKKIVAPKKETLKKEVKVEEAEVNNLKQAVEEELPRHKRYKGYKHPVTGKTWDGERYV